MRFCTLSANDLKDVIELFDACFINDPYYEKRYPDREKRLETFHQRFSDNILFCIRQGFCSGSAGAVCAASCAALQAS